MGSILLWIIKGYSNMKIDFSKLPCWSDIRKQGKVNINVKYDLSNAMYMQGGGVEIGSLAMKIYNSEGEEEYSKEECNIILNFVSKVNVMLADSLEDLIKQGESNEVLND